MERPHPDLARSAVGTSLPQGVLIEAKLLESDAVRMRGSLPVIAQSLIETPDAPSVASWVRSQLPVRAA